MRYSLENRRLMTASTAAGLVAGRVAFISVIHNGIDTKKTPFANVLRCLFDLDLVST